MRHIWTESNGKTTSSVGLRKFRCTECGESVSITRIKARNELGAIVLQYPLAMEGCVGKAVDMSTTASTPVNSC